MFEFTQTSAKGLRVRISTPSLEAGNVAELREGFEKHAPANLEAVVVEIGEVEMIDSSGIGALLGMQRRLAGDQQVCLRNVNATVLSVIELLRLHQVFRMEWDEEKVRTNA